MQSLNVPQNYSFVGFLKVQEKSTESLTLNIKDFLMIPWT